MNRLYGCLTAVFLLSACDERPDYVDEDHVKTADGHWVYNNVRYGDVKEPDPEKIKEIKALSSFEREVKAYRAPRRSVKVTESEFNNYVRVGAGCSGGIVEFDEKYNFPAGIYVSTVAHCTEGETPDSLSIQGNFLDSKGVERRFGAQNPIVWEHPDYSNIPVGNLNMSYFISDDLAILYFPDATLPKEVQPIAQKAFNQGAKNIIGKTVDAAGYAGDMIGLSVHEDCRVRTVADNIIPFSQELIDYALQKFSTVIPKGSIHESLDVIQTDCETAAGTSGTILTGEIDGVRYAFGNNWGTGNFMYFKDKGLLDAASFFRSAAKPADESPEQQRCAFVEVTTSLTLRQGPGTEFPANGPGLTSLDEVQTDLNDPTFLADGYHWRSVTIRADGRKGFVADEYLGDLEACHL